MVSHTRSTWVGAKESSSDSIIIIEESEETEFHFVNDDEDSGEDIIKEINSTFSKTFKLDTQSEVISTADKKNYRVSIW